MTRPSSPLREFVELNRDSLSGRLPRVTRCRYCGCTDDNACLLEEGPCAWADISIPCCSNPKCIAEAMTGVQR
jgi:hypothetical protein